MSLKKKIFSRTFPFYKRLDTFFTFKLSDSTFGRSKIRNYFAIKVIFYPMKVIYYFFYKIFEKNLKSDFAIVQGHKMFLDSEDSLKLSINGIFGEYETYISKKLVKPGDVVLDIGANIGYYTLIFAKIVGDNGKVYAFEPDPTNFDLLKKNIEINGYKNVELIQKAISNKKGVLKLYLNEKNKADHRLYDSHDSRNSINVEVLKLDDYFQNYVEEINFIKMDIQGSEMKAIQGMVNLLNKNRNVKLKSEFSSFHLKKAGTEPKSYLEFLINCDFRLYEIDSWEKKIVSVTVDELLHKYPVKKRDQFTDILCIRTE